MLQKAELETRIAELETELETFVHTANAQINVQRGRIEELKRLLSDFDTKSKSSNKE